jgi:hypothetical protein
MTGAKAPFKVKHVGDKASYLYDWKRHFKMFSGFGGGKKPVKQVRVFDTI